MRRNHPESPYGHSKLATERALAEAARATGIELVIIRPPLVYGPGVRANFEALLRLVASGMPLPFAALDNRRSFLHADNLTDLIAVSALHPAAPGQILLASDGVDLSTPALIRLLAQGLGRPARLFPVPGPALALARRLPRIGPRLASPIPSCAAPSGSGPRPPRAAEGLGSIAAERDRVIRLWPAISEWRIYWHHRAGVAEIKAP